MRTAVEFFNRPHQAHRHEIAAELAVAAWEKLLKAYLYKVVKHRIFHSDGKTKDFETCCNAVRDHLHKGGIPVFSDAHENLLIIYKYRNESTHFFAQGMNAILFGIFAESVAKFSRFLKEHFHLDLLPPNDVGVLPIGFNRPITPADFLSDYSASSNATHEVKQFLRDLHDAGERLAQQGIAPEHSVLVSFRIALEDAKKIKNAQAIVGVNNKEPQTATLAVKKDIRLDETQFKERYKFRSSDVRAFAKSKGVKQNKEFTDYLNSLKQDSEICLIRHLYLDNPKSQTACYYTELVFKKIELRFIT